MVECLGWCLDANLCGESMEMKSLRRVKVTILI